MENILIISFIILGSLFCWFMWYINKQNNEQHLYINKYNKKSYILIDNSFIYIDEINKEINITILKDAISGKTITVTNDEFNKIFL